MITKRRVLFPLFAFIYLLPLASPAQIIADPGNKTKIAKIKTAFIYNFTKYVTWPDEDNISEFKICVMSSQELATQLNQLIGLRKFRDVTPLHVIYCKTKEDIKPCQLLIVNGSAGEDLTGIYNKIKGKPTLMIAENLVDYKKSMISFVEVNNKMNFIINKTKMTESKLEVNPNLYKLAISKEEEWKGIFDKMKDLLNSGEKQLVVEKSDLSEMITLFKFLKNEQKLRDTMISHLEDTLKSKMKLYREKTAEYRSIERRITEGRQKLSEQQAVLRRQNGEIVLKQNRIKKQNLVISVIAILSLGVVVLLIFFIRANNQRKKNNRLLRDQKHEIETQKQLVDGKQKEILDSIEYAKRIQTALLANDKLLNAHLPEHFVLFMPKDIVAGDFYWATNTPEGFIYITADCTGHGVPGAFMSLLNISKLSETINQRHITRPDLVLNSVKTEIIQALNPEGSTEESKDGMDATLCKLDLASMQLEFASANNSFCIVRNKELLLFKPDKMPVGKSFDDNGLFTYNRVSLQKGDMIYTFTDGFADQFGGPKGKKLKYKQLKELLLANSHMDLQKQKQTLQKFFENWRGNLEQVDDVLILGVRV